MNTGEGWLLASEKAGAIATVEGVTLALGRANALDRRGARLVDAADLAKRVHEQGARALDGMAPPFRAVWVETGSGAVRAVVDSLALGHVFRGEAQGLAIVSSSATLLGQVLASRPSAETLIAYAIYGNFLIGESPFAEVVRLAPGDVATLADGRCSTERAAPIVARGDPASLPDAFRAAVATMLRAAPDAELELSGGLDSRMILAAVPAEARRGRSAITLGAPEEPSDDVRIAEGIAAEQGLSWKVLDVGGVTRLDVEDFHALLTAALEGYDHMANPLEKIPLMLAGRGRSPTARFGGQNGEILRGFYYARQPLTARTSETLARRLIRLRVAVNDRVDSSILSERARGALVAEAEDRLVRQMMGFGETWGHALDRLYLEHRMQNWVGNAASSRVVDYVPLYPFFDADVLSAALAMAPAEKLNSRAGYRLLTKIDPDLARLPLADGATPANQPRTPLGAKLADLKLDLSRVADRLGRRLRGAARPTLGSVTVIEQWRSFGLRERLPFQALASTGLFDEAALERIAKGEWTPGRPTLGFLMVAGALADAP